MKTPLTYYVSDGEAVRGPFLLEQIRELWKRGEITLTHHIRAGQSDWKPISTIADKFSALDQAEKPNYAFQTFIGILIAVAVVAVIVLCLSALR